MNLSIARHGCYTNRDAWWFDIDGPKGLHRVEVSGLEHMQDARARNPTELALAKYLEMNDAYTSSPASPGAEASA